MKRKDLVQRIQKAIEMSADADLHVAGSSCSKFREDDFESYWEKTLSAKEAQVIELHCLGCASCFHFLAHAMTLHEGTEGIVKSAQTRALLASALDMVKHRETRIELLAAAQAAEGHQGEAYGIAVSGGEGTGALIECNAWVGDVSERAGKLELWGMQVEGTEDGLLTTRPLDYLEEKLEGTFRVNPLLRLLRLHHRTINVDLKERVLREAGSLTLAIVMSIVNAVKQRLDEDLTIYCADLRQDGRLERVGEIPAKLEIARKMGVKTVVLSGENRIDCPSELCNLQEFTVHFFDHVGELFQHFGIRAEVSAGAWAPESESEDAGTAQLRLQPSAVMPTGEKEWGFVYERSKCPWIKKEVLARLIPFLEDLCQTRYAEGHFSTVFFMGPTEAILRVLPDSGMTIEEPRPMTESTEFILNLSSLVNGKQYGFVIDPQGFVVSIRKVAVEVTGCGETEPLLTGLNCRYATLSRLTDALVCLFPPTGRHLHLFCRGEMIGKYLNGRWIETRYDLLLERIRDLSGRYGLDRAGIDKTARAAVSLAEKGLGGIFVFLTGNTMTAVRKDRLKQPHGVALQRLSLENLSEEDLESLTSEECGIIIDRTGEIIALRSEAINTDSLDHTVFESAPEHHPGCRFSIQLEAISVSAGKSGTVAVFHNGEMLYKI